MSLSESFCRSGFAKFVNSPAGRVARLVAGAALLGYGYTQRSSTTGVVLMVVGCIPLLAGALDWCLISALLGGPLSGARVRKFAP